MSFPIWLEGKGLFPDWYDRIIRSRRWQIGLLIGRIRKLTMRDAQHMKLDDIEDISLLVKAQSQLSYLVQNMP